MEQVLGDCLRIVHPGVLNRLGHIRHVLFDFDGTLSVLRQGWEDVMIPLMIEVILANGKTSSAEEKAEIEAEVRAYVDRSSGILTIRQMQWLAEAVTRHGLASEVLTASEYKGLYLQRLMLRVGKRIARLTGGESTPSENMISGAEAFVNGLARRGARLYLASGTDHVDVVREVAALGLLPCFNGGVYGALDGNEDHAKERVIERILVENQLSGDELLVIGDGPVEIREGVARRALTLGMATDEIVRSGWNPRKVERLLQAGADLLAPDFAQTEKLIQILFEPDFLRQAP
ncbi:MAG: HAD family hydrolase [Chloroflexi bacterium]|nr:MAG: HAD family hydrolase [Chloroflexota bacterium]